MNFRSQKPFKGSFTRWNIFTLLFLLSVAYWCVNNDIFNLKSSRDIVWPKTGKADCLNKQKISGYCDSGVKHRTDPSMKIDQIFATWRKKNQTLSVQEIISDGNFFRTENHEILSENGQHIKNWMWTEVPDMINVLVRDKSGNYVLLQQSKYGLLGESYAVVGGYVKSGESALEAARREVLEELGMECEIMESLGNYRTDANRGFGTLFAFSGHDCAATVATALSDDLEAQRIARFSPAALASLVRGGNFREVKWTATVALALLREQPAVPTPSN